MKIVDISEKIIGIYRIVFPNNKSYIGLSNNIKRRIKEHYHDQKQPVLYRALRKYYSSEYLIEFEILERMNKEDYKLLSEREKYWINKFSSNNKQYGYNLTAGGIPLLFKDNPFAKFAEEEIIQIREMLQDNNYTIYEISKFFNCHEDTISKINTGRTYYDEKITYPIRKERKKLSGFENAQSIGEQKLQQIITLLKETNKTFDEISEISGVSKSECYRINSGKVYYQEELSYPIRKATKHKITPDEVKEIIRLLKEGEFSNTYIAQLFSCSRDTISDINNGVRHRIEGEVYPIRTLYPKRRISKITKEPVSTSLESETQDNY